MTLSTDNLNAGDKVLVISMGTLIRPTILEGVVEQAGKQKVRVRHVNREEPGRHCREYQQPGRKVEGHYLMRETWVILCKEGEEDEALEILRDHMLTQVSETLSRYTAAKEGYEKATVGNLRNLSKA